MGKQSMLQRIAIWKIAGASIDEELLIISWKFQGETDVRRALPECTEYI
jgi:hypothetical protein